MILVGGKQVWIPALDSSEAVLPHKVGQTPAKDPYTNISLHIWLFL